MDAVNEFDQGPIDKFINYLFHFSKNHEKAQIIVAAHDGGNSTPSFNMNLICNFK